MMENITGVQKRLLVSIDTHILASKYHLYIPSENKLLEEIKRLLDDVHGGELHG